MLHYPKRAETTVWVILKNQITIHVYTPIFAASVYKYLHCNEFTNELHLTLTSNNLVAYNDCLLTSPRGDNFCLHKGWAELSSSASLSVPFPSSFPCFILFHFNCCEVRVGFNFYLTYYLGIWVISFNDCNHCTVLGFMLALQHIWSVLQLWVMTDEVLMCVDFFPFRNLFAQSRICTAAIDWMFMFFLLRLTRLCVRRTLEDWPGCTWKLNRKGSTTISRLVYP